MIDKELLEYIKQQTQNGVSKKKIKKALIGSGWGENIVDEAMSFLFPLPPKSPNGLRKRILFAALVFAFFFLLFVFSLPYVLGELFRDSETVSDSDLRLKVVSVSLSDNAYYDLVKVRDTIYFPEEKIGLINDIIAGKKWDDFFVDELIRKNYNAFGYFSNASRRTRFQDPAMADPKQLTAGAVLPSLSAWIRMAKLSAVRAIYLAKHNSGKESIEEALVAARVGQKIQNSQLSTVEYLAAMSLKQTGLETVHKILGSVKLSNAELYQYTQLMDQFYDNESGLIMAFKGEYQLVSNDIDLLAQGSKGAISDIESESDIGISLRNKTRNGFYFHPNKTKNIFADYTRKNIENANKFCSEIRAIKVRRLAPSSFVEFYVMENAVGKIFHDVAAISPDSLFRKKCEEDVLVASTQAIIAIRSYKQNTGKYPISLDALMPKYLPMVPLDGFSGSALKYSPEKEVVYSVGPDLIDIGGSIGDDWRKMPNPTFNIDFSYKIW